MSETPPFEPDFDILQPEHRADVIGCAPLIVSALIVLAAILRRGAA